MSYQAVVLCGVQSIGQETAMALEAFVKNGGKLVIIDSLPHRSLSMQQTEADNSIVQNTFAQIGTHYPANIIRLSSPSSEGEMLSWTIGLLKKINIKQDVMIEKPDPNVFQIKQVLGNKDIYFFVNSNQEKTVTIKTLFPTEKKIPWIWNPEEGTRKPFPFGQNENGLTIELNPLQSLLLVFEPEMNGTSSQPIQKNINDKTSILNGSWKAIFHHTNGDSFERNFEKLIDIGSSSDFQLNTFAGTITYSTVFMANGKGINLQLGNVNKGITEVSINGKPIGINWYGKPSFPLNNLLLKGENRLEIKYTTVLSNYVRSLKNNPTAERWTKDFKNIPMGLEGDVKITIIE